jgi:hypothetical protein
VLSSYFNMTECVIRCLQDSVVSDLAKKHQTQMLHARRAHASVRNSAVQLVSELNSEQLRLRVGSVYEEDLLFAYRSLRSEYNRDVGHAPTVRRPRRQGSGDWLDGVSDGEPDVE